MANNTLWIIERKYSREYRRWSPSLDHCPFLLQKAAEWAANEQQEANPGWQYRAAKFVRLSKGRVS